MSTYGLAVGHDQTPVALHLLSAPLFEAYEFGVDDEFILPRVVAGDLSLIALKPRILWRLAALSQAEMDYLRASVYTAESVLLTIRTRKWSASGAPFTNYNVVSYMHELSDGQGRPRAGFWQEVLLEHVDCTEIP